MARKAHRVNLTAERAREALDYNPETGEFRWRIDRHRKAKAGDVAGRIRKDDNYRVIGLDYCEFLAHRLAFLIMTGEWPKGIVDHDNRVKGDDRWANLKDVDDTVNTRNREVAHAGNRSNLLGVGWSKAKHKWRARIRVSNTDTHLGYFDDPMSAHLAYASAKLRLHGVRLPILDGALNDHHK